MNGERMLAARAVDNEHKERTMRREDDERDPVSDRMLAREMGRRDRERDHSPYDCPTHGLCCETCNPTPQPDPRIAALRTDAEGWRMQCATHETTIARLTAELARIRPVYEVACKDVDADGPLLPWDRRRDPLCVAVDAARGYASAEAAIAARLRELP